MKLYLNAEKPYNLDINLSIFWISYWTWSIQSTFSLTIYNLLFIWIKKKRFGPLAFWDSAHSVYGLCISLNKSTSYPSKKKRQILITINGCLTLKLIISASLAQRSMKVEMGKRIKTWNTRTAMENPAVWEKKHTVQSEKRPPRERMTFPASQKCPHFISNDLILVHFYPTDLIANC